MLFLGLRLYNMALGVSVGFLIKLRLFGVGYRFQVLNDNVLQLKLGFSHEVLYTIPTGIKILQSKNKNTFLLVFGMNRIKVSQVAAEIRLLKSPEPYKGKGIRYSNEKIIRKIGKKSNV